METRSERTAKWLCYAGVTLLACAVQGLLLQHIRLWGVMPFLPPALCALAAAFEPGVQGSAFALAFGFVCDLAIGGAFPCFYTVAFLLTAVVAALISTKVLNAGFFSAFAVSASAYVLCGLLRALLLLGRGAASAGDLLLYGGEELLLSLPFAILLYPVFFRLHRRFHIYD